ncbi:MAG: hypothetical protein NVSMB51_15920 [Solirubrobacteraceae bacterium]
MAFGMTLGALLVALINGLAGAYGTLRWYQVRESRPFWVTLRGAQAAALLFATAAAVVWLSGARHGGDELFYLYALLPAAIGLIAEQLRIAAAEQVLENRGLADARAVGELPEREQRALVVAIMRREMGVMSVAALVVAFLALRAAGTY